MDEKEITSHPLKSLEVPLVEIQSLTRYIGRSVRLTGWVMNRRTTRNVVFVILRDGTGFVQCVIEREKLGEESYRKADKLDLETVLEITGKVFEDPRQIGGVEIHVDDWKVLYETRGYPIAKKAHGIEFLLDHRHLWLRHRRPWAVMRIRNRIVWAIHRFFQERGFLQLDAPIFTANACEGTTTLFETDFFGEPAYLSQSGQLYGEAMALAFRKIYVFGPTFRAEKSKTRRHLAEFWMVEPEIAFCTLSELMDLMEEFIRFLLQDVLQHCGFELDLLERERTILEKSAFAPSYPRLTYHEAVAILRGEKKVDGKTTLDLLQEEYTRVQQQLSTLRQKEEELRKQLNSETREKQKARLRHQLAVLSEELGDLEQHARNIPLWMEQVKNFQVGADFGGAHETVLTKLFETPVMVYNWPREVKAFYMKPDEQNPSLVKGVDMLAPEGYGEIIGGGERETSLSELEAQIQKHGLPREAFEWYLDLRRYGSVPHAGFGLGLERFIAWVCGLRHVREAIPFPRYYGRIHP